MKYLKIRDKNHRIIYKKKELVRFIYKSLFLIDFSNLKIVNKKLILNRWINYNKFYLFCKFKNRCIFSNRGKSIYKDFGLSRLFLRKFASLGSLNGIRKASW